MVTAAPSAHPLGQSVTDTRDPLVSSPELEEILGAVHRSVRAALHTDETVCRLALPDPTGRLRVVWEEGRIDGVGRKRSARRRAAFVSRRPVFVNLPGRGGGRAAFLPLVARGTAVGVLEVIAPRGSVDPGWELLEAVADPVAIMLRSVGERVRLQHEVDTLEQGLSLGRDVVGASSPQAALTVATRFLSERFRVPVAAWLLRHDGDEASLIEVRGVGSRRRRQLRVEMGEIAHRPGTGGRGWDGAVARFREVLGTGRVEVVDVGDGLILAADVAPSSRPRFHVIGALVGEALHHLAITEEAARRNDRLDLGIAWTAHEFRGPLLGVKATLELLLQRRRESGESGAMLHRSLRELEQLVDLLDGLLKWSMGTAPLERRWVDLVRVVEEAVGSCLLERGEDRVRMEAPPSLKAPIHRHHMRGAIANLVRNGLAYSPGGSKVVVTVSEEPGFATVAVADEGPGIPEEEREAIFHPFFRGTSSRGVRRGTGLGLFIARQVVTAHRGTIDVGSGAGRATFVVRLPVLRRAGR